MSPSPALHPVRRHRARGLRAAMALGALATLLLAGCSTDSVAGGEDAKDAAATSSAAPPKDITVKSEFGEVTLPGQPKAALGMYTTDVDILITLGIPLAKEQPIRGDGYDDFPTFFPQEELADVTPFANYPDYNYEKILQIQPDMILNGLGYDPKTVKRLPEIAPTYSLDAFDGRNWMEHFEETARALGKTAEYEAWVASYEKRVAEVKAKLDPSVLDKVYSPLSYYEGEVALGCYTGIECAVLEDLGLYVFTDAKAKKGEGVSLEPRAARPAQGPRRRLHDDPARGQGRGGVPDDARRSWARTPAGASSTFVKNEQIYPYDMEMTYGSPSGQMAFLDVVEKALTDG